MMIERILLITVMTFSMSSIAKDQLKAVIVARACEFASARANPFNGHTLRLWSNAYEAYALTEIIKGDKNLEEILAVGHEIESQGYFREWDDDLIYPHFIKHDNEQEQQLKDLWVQVLLIGDIVE